MEYKAKLPQNVTDEIQKAITDCKAVLSVRLTISIPEATTLCTAYNTHAGVKAQMQFVCVECGDDDNVVMLS